MSITAVVRNGTIELPIPVADGTTVEIILPEERPSRERVFGLHPGNATTTPDFDDELPDDFWCPPEK